MRVGTVGYATAQGLGHLVKAFYDHDVVQEVLLVRHNKHTNHPEWYPTAVHCNPRGIHGPTVDAVVRRCDVMLFFETPFDWSFIEYCRDRKVKTVLVPMYEWTPRRPPHWPDRVIAPSLLDQQFFEGSTYLPIPVTQKHHKNRTHALRFLHNAGHIGHRGHKGTRELLAAVQYLKSDAQLTVRAQDHNALMSIIRETVPMLRLDHTLRVETGDLPYDSLWNGHDALVQPEKFNGLSLPLQEARAAGMLVMTSDRFPHNTWLPRWPLIPVDHYERACISANYLEFDEAIIKPEAIAERIDYMYGRSIEEYSEDGAYWAEENSWDKLRDRWLEVLAA